MFGVPRYQIPGNRDTLTGYFILHPGAWGKVETALNKAVKKKNRDVTVNLTKTGSPAGDDIQIFNYDVIGFNNKGEDDFKGEIPCNSISFRLNKKGKILGYSYDAVDDRFDCSNDLKNGFVRGKKSRPMTLTEVFKQNDLNKSSGLGAAYFYFDNTVWSIQQYGAITGGSEILG